uniref:Cytochrome b-c1 complex subunit 8 n=1 Tax=Lepeophtheirus salmonis TaxID=72036 RepID=D3PGZ6_LEPSM|nr:Cytochrome b-c1 complex subunit 8 [Lepeophtheirus salmonis]
MGHLEFGNLTKIRGTIYYSLSPMEQRAFTGAFTNGLPNLFRRFKRNVVFIAPPFITSYLIWDWGEKSYKQFQRKKEDQYSHES